MKHTQPGLSQFDELPNAAHVDLRMVMGITGRSRASIYRDVSAGRLPQPVRFTTGCTRWRVGDLRQALASLAA